MNNFKSIILLCFLSFILSDEFYEQDEYKCASNIKLDTCFLSITKEDGTTVGYVDGCAKGKICQPIGSVYQCVKPKTLLEEGDKCEFNEECQSRICSSNKCVVKKEGEACKFNSNDCGKNLFCRTKIGESEGTCQKLLKEGEECSSSEFIYLLCQSGFRCYKTGTNTKELCTKKYSLEDGTLSPTDSLCKSGKSVRKNLNDWDYYCATIKNIGQCKEDPSNAGSYIADLTVSLGGATDEVVPTSCSCKSATDCSTYESVPSKEETDYIEAYVKTLNDLLKDDDTDFKTISGDYLNDKDLLEKYVLYEYKDEIPSGDDKDCVVDFFMTIEKDSSSFLKFSLFTLLACLFFI